MIKSITPLPENPGPARVAPGPATYPPLAESVRPPLLAPTDVPRAEPEYGTYEELERAGPLGEKWEVIPFESPFELICYFDDSIQRGDTVLYPWQVEVNEYLATARPTMANPLRYALCAANGSGKDAYVICPFTIWFTLTRKRALTVITSSSGVQLTAQTENYIASLAHKINTHYNETIFKITKRFIKCLKSGSEIRMFATDEAGKAEGYHPLEAGAEMAIIVNEAKSVSEEIFGALSRCTGYNYYLNVSTPGEPMGSFYKHYNSWPQKKRVTAFDCLGHLSLNHIEQVKADWGENSSIYRSQILALFTQVGGQCVVSQDNLNKLISMSRAGLVRQIKKGKKYIGGDLSAGGDETVILVVQGNCIVDMLAFREKDTTIAEDRIADFLAKHAVSGDCELNFDDGGLGHAMIDHLVKRGFAINRVLNQSRAYNSTQFGNRGAELWYNVKRMIDEQTLWLSLDDSDTLYKQLIGRHYKRNEVSGKLTLESKAEERSAGNPSPDRADALMLALSGVDFAGLEATLNVKPTIKGITEQELLEQKWATLEGGNEPRVGRYANNSLEGLLTNRGIK